MQPPLRWRHDGAEDYTWKHKSHKTGWDWTLVLYLLAQSLTSLCDPKNCLSLEKRIDLTFTSCQCRSSAPERLRTFPWKKVCWRRSSVSAIDTVMYIHYSYILYKEVRLNLKSGPSYWASRQNRPLSTEKDKTRAAEMKPTFSLRKQRKAIIAIMFLMPLSQECHTSVQRWRPDIQSS